MLETLLLLPLLLGSRVGGETVDEVIADLNTSIASLQVNFPSEFGVNGY